MTIYSVPVIVKLAKCSANKNSATLCEDLLNIIISIGIPTNDENNPLRAASTITDYCGTGAWVYLACRSLLKRFCAPIKRDYILQSSFQKFLSSETVAFGMTFPSVISFASLLVDSPGWAFAISICTAGIPAVFGGLQFAFDLCKMIRFLFRCCGMCLSSEEDKKQERILLRRYHKKREGESQKWLEENPLEEEDLVEQASSQHLELCSS